MNDMTSGHTVQAYNKELKHLNDLVNQLGELSRDQLQRAVSTLREADTKTAGEVIDREEVERVIKEMKTQEALEHKLAEANSKKPSPTLSERKEKKSTVLEEQS